MRRRKRGLALAPWRSDRRRLLPRSAAPPAQPPTQTTPSSRPRPASSRAAASRASVAPAAASQAPRPSFRARRRGLAERHGDDQSRNFVTSLEQGDFVVFEDGVKQDLTYFNKSTLPIALSLLIDTSASMEDKLRLAQEAAVGFVRRLKPEDMAQIIDFDNRVSILQQFTSDRPALEAAIRQTVPNGSTSLHNACTSRSRSDEGPPT